MKKKAEKTQKDLLSTKEESPLFLQTACFTGHRKNVDAEGIFMMKKAVDFALAIGIKTFLCGMAVGFDSIAFDYVLNKKKEYKDISLVACVPCKGQEKYFPEREQKAYQKRLTQADLVLTLSEKYYSGCMHARNRFMVDHSFCVIAYLREYGGGTGYTVNYAKEQGRNIINI